VAGDTNGKRDVFVHNLSDGTTARVSLTEGGAESDGNSWHASLTRAGTAVAFSSDATDLVGGDTNGARDVFWRTLGQDALVRASRTSLGVEGDRDSDQASWNDAGTKVLFRTASTNLDPSDTDGGARDIMLCDTATESLVCVSQAEPTESFKLLASDGAANDWFGFSVAVDGDTAVVGAYKDDDKGSDSGSAWAFPIGP